MKKAVEHVKVLRESYGRVAALVLVMTFIIVVIFQVLQTAFPKKLSVTFLDVGQGDTVLITTPSERQVLIDGGPTNKVTQALAEEVSFFDRTIDIVVATHPDADHVTGLIPVLDRYEVATVITSNVSSETGVFLELSKKIKEEGSDVIIAHKGDMLDLGDDVYVYILHPTERIARDTNDGSVSVLLTYDAHSFLLTGDLSVQYESSLLTREMPESVTVYKAGHHGSRTSSGDVLLSRIKPEYVVVSAGKDNDYGHPHEEALARIKKYSQEVLSTIDHGTISFISDGETLEIKTQK